MTYQKPNQTHDDDDNAEEASSLLTSVTASPLPSSLLRQDWVATTKKKHGAPMRAKIATTCFFLGTLAVIYGGRGSSSSNTNRTAGVSADLLRSHNQAASMYEPSQDYCFRDNDNPDKFCWYPHDYFPCGKWYGFTCTVRAVMAVLSVVTSVPRFII